MFNSKAFFLWPVLLTFTCLSWAKTTPYLKNLEDDRAEIRWESSSTNYRLNLSTSEGFIGSFEPRLVFQKNRILREPIKIYSLELKNLQAGTTYFYELKAGTDTQGVHRFKTLAENQKKFSFLLMADAQRGSKTTESIINNSVIPTAFLNSEQRSKSPVNFILFPGDLVHRGFLHKHWENQFFTPLKSLLSRVPIIPAIGNHEHNSKLFWNYFYKSRKESRFHFFDRLTSRFITLSSNRRNRKNDQIDWLKLTLSDAREKDIKFIFIQYHHPAYSEIWPGGEKKYSKKIVGILKEFSKEFDGHILVLNGHTHAYSRGQDPDFKITHIISGPLGGKIDYWNRKSKDYDMFQINSSTAGWSIFDIERDRVTHRYYSYDSKSQSTILVDEYGISLEPPRNDTKLIKKH